MSEATAVQKANGSALAEIGSGPLPAGFDAGMDFLHTMEQRWRLAKMLVASGMIPQKQPEAAMAVMLKAHELGIPPMAGFANIHFFDGKLAISADLMVAVATQRFNVTMRVNEFTNERCEVVFSRPGHPDVPSEFTMEDAKRANLQNKDNWKKYPRAMLAARAKAQGIRMIAPEAFSGLHTPDEVEDLGPAEIETNERVADATRNRLAALKERMAADVTEPGEPEEQVAETVEAEAPAPEPEPAPEEEPEAAADPAAEVLALVVDMQLTGKGDAPQTLRDKIGSLAAERWGDGTDEHVAVMTVAESDHLKKAQANLLAAKLMAAVGSAGLFDE
jgi:hypothetical protein